YEFLNHFVVKLFKDKGAQTIMIDEGLPTYESLLNIFESRSNLKATILQTYFKHLFGYNYTSVLTVNNIMRPRIADILIDKVLLYNEVNVERELDAHLLNSKEYIYPNLNGNRVLFLNERLYDYYVTMDEYLGILDDILFNLSNQFEIIYFKFHPREDGPERQKLTDVVKKYAKVMILDVNKPAEFIIDELSVKYIASFLAQILLNHSNSNCKVLYLFHKYPAIMKNPVFKNLKKILTGLNYRFFNKWEEIRMEDIGFSAIKQANDNNRYLSAYIK
ncbi:MAG: polysialyltransferase family glycosyltransferase, partial [Mucilaginibacter sp.]